MEMKNISITTRQRQKNNHFYGRFLMCLFVCDNGAGAGGFEAGEAAAAAEV